MTKIVVCGCGALGSNYAFVGRNLPISFKFIDDDRVEMQNLKNQWFVKQNIGKNKANALAQNMLSFYGQKHEAIPHRLIASNVEALLKNADLIVDCFDNPDSRRLVQRWTKENNIPCLHGALAAAGNYYGVVEWNHRFTIDEPTTPNLPTCHDQDYQDFIMRVVSCLATATKHFLEENKQIDFEVGKLSVSSAGVFYSKK